VPPPAAVTEPDETTDGPTVIEAEPATSEATSSGVLGFTVPKLSIPTIMLGRSKSQGAAPVEAPDEPTPVAEPSDPTPEPDGEPEAELELEPEAEVEPEAELETEPDTEAAPEPEQEPESSADSVAVVTPATKSVARKKGKTVPPILRWTRSPSASTTSSP